MCVVKYDITSTHWEFYTSVCVVNRISSEYEGVESFESLESTVPSNVIKLGNRSEVLYKRH